MLPVFSCTDLDVIVTPILDSRLAKVINLTVIVSANVPFFSRLLHFDLPPFWYANNTSESTRIIELQY